MGRPMFTNIVAMQFVVAMCYFGNNKFVRTCHAIESPPYIVVHSESEFEIRLYRENSWMSALVRGTTSFDKSTKDGFHRLYQYIHGANLNSTSVAISAPVLTTIFTSNSSSSTQGPDQNHYTRLYLYGKYEKAPPQPLPELNLELEKWTSHCIAVRKFSGFAADDNVGKEVESLRNSLNTHVLINGNKTPPLVVVDKSSYSIAQYNSSRHLIGRLNEVWIHVVSGFSAEGCLPFHV